MNKKLKAKIYQLLKKSEKWTKTDMLYLLRGGFWLSGGRIISSLSSFALSIAYANLLSKNIYATYKFFISISALLGISSLRGMGTSLLRSVARGYEGSILDAIKVKFKWSLLGAAIGLAVSGYYFFSGNKLLGFGMLIISLASPLTNSIICAPHFQGKKNFKILAIANSLRSIFTASLIILSLFFTQNPLLILCSFFIANFIFQISFLSYTLRVHSPNTKKDPTCIKYGKNLGFMEVISTLAAQIDKILLWHFLGPTQLAIYMFSLMPIAQVKSLIRPITSMALPKLAEQEKTVIKKTLINKIIIFTILLLPLLILYIVIAPYFFRFFFPEYLASIKYTQLFSLSLLFYPASLMGSSLYAHAKQKSLYIIKTLGPIIKISLFVLLIPYWGIMGAIITQLFSSFLNIIIVKKQFNKL